MHCLSSPAAAYMFRQYGGKDGAKLMARLGPLIRVQLTAKLVANAVDHIPMGVPPHSDSMLSFIAASVCGMPVLGLQGKLFDDNPPVRPATPHSSICP